MNLGPECMPCPAGTFSTGLGQTSIATCDACASGRFSAPGKSFCLASGCTDAWANNYNERADVDDGTCEYTCALLHAQFRTVGSFYEGGGCIIYDAAAESWQQVSIDGRNMTETMLECGQELLTGGTATAAAAQPSDWCGFSEVPFNQSWIVQGSPLPGSTVDGRILPIFPLPIFTHEACDLALRKGQIRGHDLVGSGNGIHVPNHAESGNPMGPSSFLYVEDFLFKENWAANTGGASLVGDGWKAMMKHVQFESNSASQQRGGDITCYCVCCNAWAVSPFSYVVCTCAGPTSFCDTVLSFPGFHLCLFALGPCYCLLAAAPRPPTASTQHHRRFLCHYFCLPRC
eukprot:SAG22_NODE_482_length_9931_cov_9.247254_4_plen_345_part_00